jgi:hypothetical protein
MTPPQVRALAADEVRSLAPALAEILVDCIDAGASVSFMAPFSIADALAYWEKVADAVAADATGLILGAVDGKVAGTVQIAYDMPPNQPHRAEIRKLFVHRRARRSASAGR